MSLTFTSVSLSEIMHAALYSVKPGGRGPEPRSRCKAREHRRLAPYICRHEEALFDPPPSPFSGPCASLANQADSLGSALYGRRNYRCRDPRGDAENAGAA